MSSVKCRAKNPATCRKHGTPPNEKPWMKEIIEKWGVEITEPVKKASTTKRLQFLEIQEAAVIIAEKYANLEFPNHANEEAGGYLTLADMADAKLAYNNCDAASAEIVERLNASDFNADNLQYIGVETSDSQKFHAAVLVTKENQQFVVDYTIRQFNSTLPYPYIATRQEWMTQLEKETSLRWHSSRRNQVNYPDHKGQGDFM